MAEANLFSCASFPKNTPDRGIVMAALIPADIRPNRISLSVGPSTNSRTSVTAKSNGALAPERSKSDTANSNGALAPERIDRTREFLAAESDRRPSANAGPLTRKRPFPILAAALAAPRSVQAREDGQAKTHFLRSKAIRCRKRETFRSCAEKCENSQLFANL
jgi:hypothetical protein